MKFGEKLRLLRKENDISLRNLAEMVKKTPAYLSDVEKCKTKAPCKELVNNLISNLKLKEEDSQALLELAADERSEIPADIYFAIINNSSLKKLIRTVVKIDSGNSWWDEFTDILMSRTHGGSKDA